MIPVKLTLCNFMPYRDNVPPLDFTGIHLATICGDNGSGKSAIIDAITWALWGETRAGARNHDDLIHAQQNEMQVEFEFKVGDDLYRVIRKHARPKKRAVSGSSSLDLFGIKNGEPLLMSGDRIQETQHKITEILHMDYDTFVNSSYLRQGHADQFTVADATERKKVLANILGLSRYEGYEDKAKEMARSRDSERMSEENAIRDIDSRLAVKPVLESDLSEAESRLSILENSFLAAQSNLIELRRQKDDFAAKEREARQLDDGISRTRKTAVQFNFQAEQYRARLKEFESLLSMKPEIEANYARFIEFRKRHEDLNRKLGVVNKLAQRHHELDMVVERAQAGVVTEHKLVENEITKLESISQNLPKLNADLEQARSRLRQVSEFNESLEQKRARVLQLNGTIHSLEAEQTSLSDGIAEISEKLTLLSAQPGAVCPLCERELEGEHRRLIEDKYEAEKFQKSKRLASVKTELTEKRSELTAATADILKTEQRLYKETASAQNAVSLLEQGIRSAHEAAAAIETEKDKLLAIEERLNKREFAAGEQIQLKQIEEELARNSYDAKLHDSVRQALSGLEIWEARRQKLGEAEMLSAETVESLAAVERHAAELNAALESDVQKRQALGFELTSQAQLAEKLIHAENELNHSDFERKEAQESVGNLRGKLENVRQLAELRKEKEAALHEAVKEAGLYAELARAFGKNGIQALLIEMAIPELEEEANNLLGRMTDNRMHVRFDTQRETKKGEVAETLDILIADELGTRTYEMFSGGEAFRINFAIRIALSKMLAKRAGAPLPTLIIDEGFGTQDDTGLEKLKEAIISIQNDFQKILVITHVDELRDAFPARIDVVKTAAGSTIEVIE